MTTIEFDRLTGGYTEQSRGWTVSVLLHGVAVAGVVLLMAKVDQPVAVDLFQWDVSMVDAEKPSQSEPPPVQKVVQPPPTPVKPNPPIRKAVQPIVQQTPQQTDVAVNAEPLVESTEIQQVMPQVVMAEPIQTPTESVIEQTVPVESSSPTVESKPVEYRQVQYRRTQADYGWLRDLLWKRIEELKRYPAQAKFNHWEGKVVVQAVIKADGTVGDVRVAESSGHAVLDEEALVVMRKASPLRLTHHLEKSQIIITVPISYRLDG